MVVGMAVFGATESNPSGSRPNFFGRQHLTFDKGGKGVGDFRGIIVFLQWLWEWQYSMQREGQAPLALRKVGRIVRFWKG